MLVCVVVAAVLALPGPLLPAAGPHHRGAGAPVAGSAHLIAFVARNPSGYFDIDVMDPDGTAIRTIAQHRRSVSHLTWSPDGSRIAFADDFRRRRTSS
jgi:WD40 repeat protein